MATLPTFVYDYEDLGINVSNKLEKNVIKILMQYASKRNQDALHFLALRLTSECNKGGGNLKFLKFIKKESNFGNVKYTFFLGNYYSKLSSNTKDYYAMASVRFFMKAYMQGCEKSLLILAHYYQTGFGFKETAFPSKYDILACELRSADGKFFRIEEYSNVAALYRMGKYYYKTNPRLALDYFSCAATSIHENDFLEEATYSALFYLGLLAQKNILFDLNLNPYNLLQTTVEKDCSKNALMPNIQVAIMYMRLADNTDSTAWLETRGISEREWECVGCKKPAKISCINCNMTYFCSKQCFYECGILYHEQFCLEK